MRPGSEGSELPGARLDREVQESQLSHYRNMILTWLATLVEQTRLGHLKPRERQGALYKLVMMMGPVVRA